MNDSINQQNMSSVAYLREKDTALNWSSIEGSLVLSNSKITFTPVSEGQPFTMKIDEIVEADLTNIMAKDQIIFTMKDGGKHIITFFPPGSPKVDKKIMRALLIPGGLTYWMFSRMSKYAQISQQWKQVLISSLPAAAVKQRVEVHIVRALLVALLVSLFLLALLATFIWLIPR
jgi:hypothetical protein